MERMIDLIIREVIRQWNSWRIALLMTTKTYFYLCDKYMLKIHLFHQN